MTLHSERFGQTYHSRHGALTESLHVFLDAGWSKRSECRVMDPSEVGWGVRWSSSAMDMVAR